MGMRGVFSRLYYLNSPHGGYSLQRPPRAKLGQSLSHSRLLTAAPVQRKHSAVIQNPGEGGGDKPPPPARFARRLALLPGPVRAGGSRLRYTYAHATSKSESWRGGPQESFLSLAPTPF